MRISQKLKLNSLVVLALLVLEKGGIVCGDVLAGRIAARALWRVVTGMPPDS